MDGLPLGHRNLTEYDYHHAMAQHAANLSAANNSASLHSAMAQLPMLPTGLNLTVGNHHQGGLPAGLGGGGGGGGGLANSNAMHHHLHHSGAMGGNYGASPGAGGGGGKMKHKKPKVNKDGVPAPKRATTAYINFTQWYREEMKKSGRTIPKIGDFGKECAGKWNSMTEDEKQPFLNAAARDRERYKKEMAIFKPARDVNKPKRPGTAFMLFMGDFRKEMAGREPEGGVAALAKLGGERWRGMTEDDKRPYVEQQTEEKLRYEQSMEEYRRKQNLETLAAKQQQIQQQQQMQQQQAAAVVAAQQAAAAAAQAQQAVHGGEDSHEDDASNSFDGSTSHLPRTPTSESSTPPISLASSPPPASQQHQQNSQQQQQQQMSPPSPPPTSTAAVSALSNNSLSSLPIPAAHSSSLAMAAAAAAAGYSTQHSLPTFATNYNQAHVHPSPYLSSASYGHYNWS